MVVWFGGQKYGFELKWGGIMFFLKILKKIVIMIKEITSQSDHIDLYIFAFIFITNHTTILLTSKPY